MKKITVFKFNKLLLLPPFAKFILPFLLQSPVYGPQRDELLYLAEGHHMAWGSMEVPPLLSVFVWLTHIFGGGMFWIKFWPSLFGAFTFILTGKIILSLGGKWFALLLAFLAFITGAFCVRFIYSNPVFRNLFLDINGI